MPKLFLEAEIKAEQDGNFEVIASSGDIDRMGDRINPEGWDLRNFKKNPVMLWAHDAWSPPVARAKRVWVEDKKLKIKGEFAPTPFAQELKTLVERGFLNAVSVGFIPLMEDDKGQIDIEGKMYRRAEEEEIKSFEEKRLRGEGMRFEKQELLEVSWVAVPALASALVTARKGGFELPLLAKSLNITSDAPAQLEGVDKKQDLVEKFEEKADQLLTQMGEAISTLATISQKGTTPVKLKGRAQGKIVSGMTPELHLMQKADQAVDRALARLKQDKTLNKREILLMRIASKVVDAALIKAKAKRNES